MQIIFAICGATRIIENYFIRTDKTVVAENFVHKLLGIGILLIVLKMLNSVCSFSVWHLALGYADEGLYRRQFILWEPSCDGHWICDSCGSHEYQVGVAL